MWVVLMTFSIYNFFFVVSIERNGSFSFHDIGKMRSNYVLFFPYCRCFCMSYITFFSAICASLTD